MKLTFDTFKTPLGEFSVGLNAEGALISTAFGDVAALGERASADGAKRDAGAARLAREQLLEYFEGGRREFTMQLAAQGTAFQREVWDRLRQIPFGETCSYADLAKTLGRPKAFRAVGQANGANPICVIVPCHRVIASSGKLAGFAFGEDIKRWLLNHERDGELGGM